LVPALRSTGSLSVALPRVVTSVRRHCGQDSDRVLIDRVLIGSSRTPFCEAARALLAAGCDSSISIVMRHAGCDSRFLQSTIGQTARLGIKGTPHGPLRRYGAPEGAPESPLIAQERRRHVMVMCYDNYMRISSSRRRAFELLASSPDGCPEAMLRVSHGVDTPMTAALVEEGLASVSQERVRAGVLEITRKALRR